MSTSADQLRRLLAFLPRIADGQEHTIADVAAQLGVDAQTITRDLHALSERWGDPPGWIENVALFIEADRVCLEAASHFRRPVRLSSAELRALDLGLAMLRRESSPERRAAIDSALQRLRAIASSTSAGESSPERIASLGTDRELMYVPVLREALRVRQRVVITYRKGSGDSGDRRSVCPFTFAVEKGVWYLLAHCDRSEGIRIFRLDRIEGVESLDENFDPPTDLDLTQMLSQRSAFVGDPPEQLRVRYSPRVARWIAEREKGTSAADGSLEVEYPLADRDWAVRHALQYGPDAEVLAPKSVREAIVERLRSI